MSLESIIYNRPQRPRITAMYGPGGVGKTRWAAGAPFPIIIPTEDGFYDVDCPAFPLCGTWDDILGHLRTLYAESHDFKTVIVDSLDWAERLIHQDVAAQANVDSIEGIGFGKGYQMAMRHWGQFGQALNSLRNDRGMNVVLIAHSRISRFSPPDGETYDRHGPKLHKLAAEYIIEFCDEVFFANYRVFQKTTGEGFNKRTIGVGTGERVIYTTEKPSHVAKHRVPMPDQLRLDWADYEAALNAAS